MGKDKISKGWIFFFLFIFFMFISPQITLTIFAYIIVFYLILHVADKDTKKDNHSWVDNSIEYHSNHTNTQFGSFSEVENSDIHSQNKNTSMAKKMSVAMKKATQKFKEEKVKEITQEEIDSFYKVIRSQKIIPIKDVKCGASISTDSLSLFEGFIANTEKELFMTTNVFSDKTLIELFTPIRDKPIGVTIITAREKDKKYNAKKFFSKHSLNLKIIVCSKNHSKIMVRDKSKILIGSSNLDDFSLCRALETNIVSKKKENIKEAYSLVKSLIENKDIREESKGSDVVYSGSLNNNLPLIIKRLLRQEMDGLTILMPLQLFNVDIVEKIKDWNINNVDLTIELSNNWAKGEDNAFSKRTYLFLKQGDFGENLSIRFNRETIHSKTYLFHSQKKSLISSLNMTTNSWSSLFEAGLVSIDSNDFTIIQNKINSMEKTILNLDYIPFETTSSVAVWKQRPTDCDKTSIPWDLPEKKDEFVFEKEDDKIFFKKIVKDRESKNNDYGEKTQNVIIEDKKISRVEKHPERRNINAILEMFNKQSREKKQKEVMREELVKLNGYIEKIENRGYKAKIIDHNIEIYKDKERGILIFDNLNNFKEIINALVKKYDRIYFIHNGRIANNKITRKFKDKIIQKKTIDFEKAFG